MATIMRARFTMNMVGLSSSGPGLFQTYWRPGTSGGSTADATDILARVRAMLNGIVTSLSTACTYTAQSQVDALEDSTGALTGSFFGTAPAPVTGTTAGEPMPAQTCYLIRATTGLVVGPRLLRGRTFLGLPAETNNTTGAPSTGSVTNLNTVFPGMLTGGTTLSFPVVWHRPNPAAAVPAGTSGAIVGYQCEPDYWGSQRGRRF